MDEKTLQSSSPLGKKKSHFFLGMVLLVLIVAGAGYYVITKERMVGSEDDNFDSGANATTTIEIGGITFEIPPGGSVHVEEVSADFGPAPRFDRNVVFPADFPTEAYELWQTRMQTLVNRVALEPYSIEAWIDIGLTWKMIEDFEGAREAWEYALKLSPENSVILGNLGFLNGFYLGNHVAAEDYFRRAISASPQEYLYEQLFSFYRDVRKDNVKARALAEEGKRAIGNEEFFNSLINTLK